MVLRSEVIPSELLRTFLLIEKTGSYTDAADILGLSQPAISSHMKRLQQMVGGELFDKSHGGLSLTSRGEIVKHYATRILNLNWQMLRQCGAGESKRTFRIGVQSVFAATHLASMQQNIARRLPDHRTVITWGTGAEIYDDLKAGYLDAAYIVRDAIEDTQRGQCWDETMCWVSCPGFVVGEARPVPLLSWPDSLSDRLAIASLSQNDTSYTVVLVATTWRRFCPRYAQGSGFASCRSGWCRKISGRPSTTFCRRCRWRVRASTSTKVCRNSKRSFCGRRSRRSCLLTRNMALRRKAACWNQN